MLPVYFTQFMLKLPNILLVNIVNTKKPIIYIYIYILYIILYYIYVNKLMFYVNY